MNFGDFILVSAICKAFDWIVNSSQKEYVSAKQQRKNDISNAITIAIAGIISLLLFW